MKIAVKYCGGCNPRYDRVAAAQKLRERLPEIDFCGPDEAGCLAALVLCGCKAACASREGLMKESLLVCSEQDLKPAQAALLNIVKRENA